MRPTLVLFALGLVLAGAASAAGSGPAGPCGLRGSVRVVAHGDKALVVRRGFVYYACLRGSRRARAIGTGGGYSLHGPESFVLAGPHLAFLDVVYPREGAPDATLVSIDLRTRRLVRRNGGVVGRPALTRRGALAFVTDEGASLTLRRIDGRGDVVLDEGSGIDPDSVAVTQRGDRVFWLHAGAARTADLR